MEKNFWTEENKIMNFDSLIRVDMQKRLMNMENQIVYGRDIADICYNYDLFIGQRDKAIQFIADYADDFIRSINRYQKITRKPFADIGNPLKSANLMALYRGRDIIRTCKLIRDNWDQKIVLNLDNLNELIQQINGPELPEHKRIAEKIENTKETLLQVSEKHLFDCLQRMVGKNLTLADLRKELNMPILSEQTAKSVLRNDFSEVVAAVMSTGANARDVYSFVEHAVFAKTEELMASKLFIDNPRVHVTQDFINALKDGLSAGIKYEVDFKPNVMTREPSVRELKKTAQVKPVREK